MIVGMVLLITPSLCGQECAAALEAVAKEKVQLTTTLKQGLACLRQGEFSIVVVDECLVDLDPASGDLLARRMGTAYPVYVNLGISDTERVMKQIRAALRRREEERSLAFRAAEARLRSELRGDLTALLLSSDMVLASALPEEAQVRIKSMRELATRMRSRLQVG